MNHKQSLQPKKTFPKNLKPKAASISKSNWWTPLWRGLAVESSAKHFRAMGSAVWLYLYLLVFANRATGNLFRRVSTIAGDMGISSRTISRWLRRLKDASYIKSHQTGRSLQISITKWKPIKKR